MKKKLIASLAVITLASTILVGSTIAYFSDTVETRNNTISTGNAELKLFYDCIDFGEPRWAQQTFDNGTGVEVNGNPNRVCTNELDALRYQVDDGRTLEDNKWWNKEDGDVGDWSTTNGWWDVLSSPIDHTLVGPSWTFNSDDDRDRNSVGNSGDYPMQLYVFINYEDRGSMEGTEPEDYDPNQPNGGDRTDPYRDVAGWEAIEGRVWDTNLATKIRLTVEIINPDGQQVSMTRRLDNWNGYQWNSGYVMDPDEVVNVRYSWEWINSGQNEDEFQNLYFDFGVTYEGRTY